MRKITIEFDESEDLTNVLWTTERVLSNCNNKFKTDRNIRVVLDKGLKSGVITQRGVCVPFMQKGGHL